MATDYSMQQNYGSSGSESILERAAGLAPDRPADPGMSIAPQPIPQRQPSQQEIAMMQEQESARRGYGNIGLSQQDMDVATAAGVSPLQAAARRRYVGGSAAYDPQAEIAKQVAVPVSKQKSVQGGDKYSKNDMEEYEANSIQAIDAGLERQRQLASAEEDDALNTALIAGVNASDERRKLGEIELKRQKEYDAVNKEIEDIADTKTDQGRVFRDKGALGTALSSIGSVLQKYGAARAGVFQIKTALDSEIENDIASQEREIRMKGAKANNKLADLRARYDGDIDRAKMALGAAQKTVLSSRLEAMQVQSRSPVVKAQLAEAQALLSKDLSREMMELHAANRGMVTETTNMQMRTPQAGSSGRVVYDLSGLASDATAAEQLGYQRSKDTLDAQGSNSEEQKKLNIEAGNKLAEIDQGSATIDLLMGKLGIEKDPKTGQYIAPKEEPPGFGYFVNSKMTPDWALTREGQLNAQLLKQVKTQAGKLLAGTGQYLESDKDTYEPQVVGNGTIEQFVNGVNASQSSARQNRLGVEATYGAPAVQQYERGVGSAKQRRTQKLEQESATIQPVNLLGQ